MTFIKFLLILLVVYVVYYAFIIATDKKKRVSKTVDIQGEIDEDYEEEAPIPSDNLIKAMESEFKMQRNVDVKLDAEIDQEAERDMEHKIQRVNTYALI